MPSFVRTIAKGYALSRRGASTPAKSVDMWGNEGWSVFGTGHRHDSRLPGSDREWLTEAGPLWLNGIVRMIHKWKSDTFNEAPLVVTTTDENGETVYNVPHALTDFLANPNPFMSWPEMQSLISLGLDISGNAYLHKIRGRGKGVSSVEWLPFTHVAPAQGAHIGEVGVYKYQFKPGVTMDIKPEDMIHIRDGRDPANLLLGLSRFGAVLREIVGTNESSTYNVSMLRNMGIPGVHLSQSAQSLATGKVTLTQEAIERFKQMYADRFTRDRRFEPFIDNIGFDVTQLGFSPDQVGVDRMFALFATVICAAANLDPMVLALPSSSRTYSNFEEANKAAWDQCVIPEQKMIDEQIENGLRGDIEIGDDEKLSRDYRNVSALQENEKEKYSKISIGYNSGWLSRYDARVQAGLPAEESDKIFKTDVTGGSSFNDNGGTPDGSEGAFGKAHGMNGVGDKGIEADRVKALPLVDDVAIEARLREIEAEWRQRRRQYEAGEITPPEGDDPGMTD